MGAYCDLHTHSVFSDGSCTPAELIDLAQEAGLSSIALCDHNMVDGLPDFLAAAAGKKIQAICGAEFSVDFQGTELHLLGLFIPEDTFVQVSDLMRTFNEGKERSNIALAEALSRAGYSIDYEAIKAQSPSGKINRLHFAEELTRLGYTESTKQAFDTLLSRGGGYYKEPRWPGFFEMIDFIRSLHAVPVLAHPFLSLSPGVLAQVLPVAKRRGLGGMECLYSTFSKKETDTALFLAARNGLIPSGGSDFHGSGKPEISLGTGHGNLKIPAQWAEALKRDIR